MNTPMLGAIIADPLQKAVDGTTTPGITYVGESVPGVAESETKWRIYIVDETVADNTKIMFPVNESSNSIDSGFRFAWIDRATLTYSFNV